MHHVIYFGQTEIAEAAKEVFQKRGFGAGKKRCSKRKMIDCWQIEVL